MANPCLVQGYEFEPYHQNLNILFYQVQVYTQRKRLHARAVVGKNDIHFEPSSLGKLVIQHIMPWFLYF